MHRNILEFEPANALFVPDNDPLIFYRAIADYAQYHLTTEGIIYLELNEHLGKETAKMFSNRDFSRTVLYNDLSNKCRFLTVQR
jgi:release factor glutamine methyltransferase